MPRLLAVPLVCLLSALTLHAQDDVVMKAMRDEMERSVKKLQLEKLEKPYFFAYRVQEATGIHVSASFGSLIKSDSKSRSRFLTVEVRVGDPELDNTNFLSISFEPSGVSSMFAGTAQLPLDNDYNELRRQMWIATDSAYKRALEVISQKRAVLQNKTRIDDSPDFSKEAPITSLEDGALAQINQAEAEDLARDLSALSKQMKDIHTSTVQLSVSNNHVRYVNSEGTSYSRQTPFVSFTASAATQVSDGMPLEDFVSFYGRSLEDLPKKEELVARVQEMGGRLTKLRAAPLVEPYNGPLLFEGQAAAELFSQVFAPGLLASRRPISDNPRLAAQFENPFQDKLGARVLPRFLRVVDNPALTGYEKTPLVSGYKVDDDGVPARETKLVESGILKTLLSTRTPVRGIARSTGNRRGAGAMPSNLVVTADNGLTDAEQKGELLKLVKERGKDYGIIVRRIGNPSYRLSRETPFLSGAREPGTVESLILAYKLFPDGREELVRNGELSGLSAATFKEITAASKSQVVYSTPFRAQSRSFSPFFSSVSSGESPVIVSFVVPSLLFEDVSLKKPSGEIPNVPVSKHPFFER